jgi:hypothetical protein
MYAAHAQEVLAARYLFIVPPMTRRPRRICSGDPLLAYAGARRHSCAAGFSQGVSDVAPDVSDVAPDVSDVAPDVSDAIPAP